MLQLYKDVQDRSTIARIFGSVNDEVQFDLSGQLPRGTQLPFSRRSRSIRHQITNHGSNNYFHTN
jgi:hypothetical protein